MIKYNCDNCGMNLVKVGKTEVKRTLLYKVLKVEKIEKWKCPSGCELIGINNKLKESLNGEKRIYDNN